MPSLADFYRVQFRIAIPRPTTSFASKTVIVTGANGGLGVEICKHLLRLRAEKIILACRSQVRGDAAKQQLESFFGCKPGIIEVWELDLESPSSIKKFAERANTLQRVDVVINNAGIQTPDFKVVYGTERTLAVNAIATFLLILQLLPKLKETARNFDTTPHCTIVSSALYDVAKYPEKHDDDLFAWYRDPAHVDGMNQYDQPSRTRLDLVLTCLITDTISPSYSSYMPRSSWPTLWMLSAPRIRTPLSSTLWIPVSARRGCPET